MLLVCAFNAMEASDALIKACKHATLEEVHKECLLSGHGDGPLASEIREILKVNKTQPLGSKIVPGRPVLLKRLQDAPSGSKNNVQRGWGAPLKIGKAFEKASKKPVPVTLWQFKNPKHVREAPLPKKPRAFKDCVNPAGLIHFRMPELWDAEFKGFDILLACESTFIYGRAKTTNMAEKYPLSIF